MSHDAPRIVAAARSLRSREGPGFPLTLLARPAGMSRATLYRRLSANTTLAAEVERIRTEGTLNPREEFVGAAIALLAEKGLAELTMDGVAARAGLSTATLYRHFADRDELVREVLRNSVPTQTIRQALQFDGSIEEVLERFVNATLTRLRDQPHIIRLLALGSDQDMVELRKLRRSEERISTALIAFLESHQSEFGAATPKQLAASLMGQVLGVFVFQKAHEWSERADAETIVKLFLHGARGQKDERTAK